MKVPKNKFYRLLILVCLSIGIDGICQDTLNKYFIPQFTKGQYYQIESIYGTKYKGVVSEETYDEIVLTDKKTNFKHHLKKGEIRKVTPFKNLSALKSGKFDDDYYTNYYMIAENALPFIKDGANTTSHYFLLENFNYNFSEHWAMSVNILGFLPVSVGAKCSYQLADDIYFGANVYVYGFPGSNFNSYAIPFIGSAARITKGDNNTNFTLGAGLIGVNNKLDTTTSKGKSALFSQVYYLYFGYANRFSKKLAFNVENFTFPQALSNGRGGSVNLNITGISLKWLRHTNVHWNFGCYGLYLGSLTKLNTNSKIIPIPYISYAAFFE